MKVILAMVQSADGKITKWNEKNIYTWTSREDTEYFRSLIRKIGLVVMGRKTYEAVRPKPQDGILRIVFTKDPSKYRSHLVPLQLEFTNKSPKELIKDLERRRYEQMLLVGGATLNTAFLKEGLVKEIWLTIEPRIFDSGKLMVKEGKLNIELKLFEFKKLNDQGTLLLKYQVMKSDYQD